VTVLVLTHWFDPTADHIVEELNRRSVPVFRCDVAEFPQRLTVAATLNGTWVGTLRNPTREVELREVSGVLYRRPTAFDLPDGMAEQARRWAAAEARLGFGGLLASLNTWLNHPHAIAHAEYKPVQLQVAAQCGLNVPRTLITNDPKRAQAFCEQIGEVVYKPMASNHVDQDGEPRMIYATRVPRESFGDPGIAHTAHLLQEWVEHEYAVRVAVVDGRFFATAIHSHSHAAHIDWRSDYEALTYEPAELPGDVRRGVRALMATLGLRFGALDFLVRADGTHVFLEINPNGQWAWIEHAAPAIASAIADALTEGRRDE
jgi:ATP-grasp ribosomal peptide maturase